MKMVLALLCILLFAACSDGESPERSGKETTKDATVVYLVRHAETMPPPYDTNPPNPHLSPEGVQRANDLAALLSHARLTEIMSSGYNRTQETAAVMADRLGLQVETYDARNLEDVAAQIKASSGRILVTGHSNTTPELVRRLGGEAGQPIDDKSEYDRLYIVILGEEVSTTQTRYGAQSASPSE